MFSSKRYGKCYNTTYEAVLGVIANAVKSHITPTPSLTVDIGDSYTFSFHTDLRPDIVWWDERFLTLVELTICFENNFVEAARRKSAKHMDLVQQAQIQHYKTVLITLQVGSHGIPDLPGFEALTKTLNMPSREVITGVARGGVKASHLWIILFKE